MELELALATQMGWEGLLLGEGEGPQRGIAPMGMAAQEPRGHGDKRPGSR